MLPFFKSDGVGAFVGTAGQKSDPYCELNFLKGKAFLSLPAARRGRSGELKKSGSKIDGRCGRLTRSLRLLQLSRKDPLIRVDLTH